MKIAVLGFGWAGVCVSWFIIERLGAGVVAIDGSSSLGGLLRSERINGFTFDVGGTHVIFSKDTAVLKELVSLLGDNVVVQERRGYVLLNGVFVPYPFENGVYVLPPEERAELISDFIMAQLELAKTPEWRPRNFLEWVRGYFGKSIAERYLIPYNEKIWKRPLDQISADWVYIPGRLPIPDIPSLVKSAAGIPTRGYVENATFHYPLRGGIQALYEALLNKVLSSGRVDVVKGERVESIKHVGRRYIVNRKYEVDRIISTIPLPELVKALDAPEDVIKAAEGLDYNQVVVVGIAVNKRAPDQHWIYVPDRKIIFHRYVWISNYSPLNAPPDKSAVLAEVTIPKGQNVNIEHVVEEVIDGFEKLDIFKKEDVLFTKAWLHKYGYPVYTLNHNELRNKVLTYLKDLGIVSTGRWGAWHYWNMDKVYIEAKNTVTSML